jgi:hypothetical protein
MGELSGENLRGRIFEGESSSGRNIGERSHLTMYLLSSDGLGHINISRKGFSLHDISSEFYVMVSFFEHEGWGWGWGEVYAL